MAEILNMQNICKSYYLGEEELEVLHQINLTIHSGEFISILGPSGSGKSTMMNIIGCLDAPTSGKYLLSDKDIEDLDETEMAAVRNKEIGFVFQSFQLLPRLSALKNVELPLIYSNISASERKKRAKAILTKVGLSDKMYNLPSQLSGGQQQRVAIARALVTEPTILLADEPTGALDQKTGAQVMELFEELHNDGKTIIMITHDHNIASHARRVVTILDGNLTEQEGQ
jgi:putative ABC transport system ATP-binding protein